MRISDWLISILAGLVFISISSWNINLPGLQYDESLGAAPAVNFIVENPQTEPMQINPSVIRIFDRPLPVMIMTYIGPIKTLLYIPIFYIFDISVITVRLLPIIFVFFCFPLAYYISKSFFNRELAIFVVGLMSVDPSIIFYLTRDVGPAALQVFFKLLAIAFLIIWWNKKSDKFLYLSFLIFGLGVTHKVDFFWIIVGLGVAFGLIFYKDILTRLKLKQIILSLIYFCIGAIPIVVFNIVTGGYTFSPLFSKLSSAHSGEAFNFVHNLFTRINQLIDIHNGNFISFLFCEKEIYTNALKYFYPFLLILSFVIIIVYSIRSKRENNISYATTLLLFIVIVIIETCFSPTELSGHHLLAVTPFMTVIIVYSILTNKFLKVSVKYILLSILFIYLFYSSITINKFLSETGGTGSWSDEIYDLNNYLLSENKEVYALDWGFTNNLIILSKGELKMHRLYTLKWDEKNLNKILAEAMNENALYLAHSKKYTTFHEIRKRFFEIARELNFKVIERKSFSLKNGENIYIVYNLKKD